MYKFKKTKNVYYDHIYTHPMFKSGKIDLLRNIQRKTAEMTNLTPTDSQSLKIDDEIDVDTLIQENMHYKRIHKELIGHVELIENKMKNIRSEVSMLHGEQIKADANEKFLKNVLKSLTKVYGFETIAKIIETDVEDIPSMNAQQSNVEEYSGEMSSEESSDEKCSQFSQEYQLSENFSTHDTPQLSENIHHGNKDDSKVQQPLFLLDFGFGNNFSNDENAEISPMLSKVNSYRIWVDELKNTEYNADMFFNLTNQRFVGGNIEDF